MNVKEIRSDKIYRKIITASLEERAEIYRNELMKPFEFKWNCIGVPLKAEQPNGYDVVSFVTMGGCYHPSALDNEHINEVEQISKDSFWDSCQTSIEASLKGFEKSGIQLPTKDYIFTVMLNDPKSPMAAMTGDYCGDGGIPGFIIGTIIPNEKSLQMLPIALAHETNHNVRWQFQKWNPNITLADMVVSEGLAENFATHMFGEDKIGIWVKNTNRETLEQVIKAILKEHLFENDFNKLSSYLYGDEIMALRGAKPLGIPYCAGYAFGYALVKYYLEKTGKSIYEATIIGTDEILKEVKEFWN